MGRPATRERLKQERMHLAGLIDDALRTGQRGDGTPSGRAWTDVELAKKVNISAQNVSTWRNRKDPSRPVDIVPVLNAFHGDLRENADARAAMHKAWKLAGGIDADDPPDPRTIKAFSAVAEVVTLLPNQPTPDNHGNLIVPYTLRFQCDKNCTVNIKVDGKPVAVTMDIGFTEARLTVESRHWQPLHDTLFREGKHGENTAPGFPGDCVVIKGPVDEQGRIVGSPLGDDSRLMMERQGDNGDGPIVMSVAVPRDGGFSVTFGDRQQPSATQKSVIDAIFAEAIPKDSRDRLEVASATVKPGADKSRA
jgi:hypothetical protein